MTASEPVGPNEMPMTVTDSFWAAATSAARLGMAGPDDRGARMAWAAAHVLDGQGADITISGRLLRIPWGASSRAAAGAEQMQFTAGAGPTFLAHAWALPVRAEQALVMRLWPDLGAELLRTPFSSILALPLGDCAVLTVYFADDHGAHTVDQLTAQIVGDLVLAALLTDTRSTDPRRPGRWPSSAGRLRSQVSVAVGIVASMEGLRPDDALALLRAKAFCQGRMVDAIADEVVCGPR